MRKREEEERERAKKRLRAKKVGESHGPSFSVLPATSVALV